MIACPILLDAIEVTSGRPAYRPLRPARWTSAVATVFRFLFANNAVKIGDGAVFGNLEVLEEHIRASQ